MGRIQIIAIAGSLASLFYVGRLIVKGRLREEYAFVWLVCTVLLIVFSFWRGGLDVVSRLAGIFEPPNMVFTGAITAILAYLLHLSLTVSRLHEQNRTIAQELALLKSTTTPKKSEEK
jgi:hypothetical protein